MGQFRLSPFFPKNRTRPVCREFFGRVYCEFLFVAQRRINKASAQRTTTQIAGANLRFDRIAVMSAEMPKAKAIRNQKTVPRRILRPRSWQTLRAASPETSNCPAISCQLAPVAAMYVIIGDKFLLRSGCAETRY